MIRGKDFSFATIEIKNRLRESVGGFVFASSFAGSTLSVLPKQVRSLREPGKRFRHVPKRLGAFPKEVGKTV
jgi:hypothetical protein